MISFQTNHSSYCKPFNIPFTVKQAIHIGVTGGTPAERLILSPSGLDFGMYAGSVTGSAEIQSGLTVFGDIFRFGMGMQCNDVQIRSGKTLYLSDQKTIGTLDGMTLEGIPLE